MKKRKTAIPLFIMTIIIACVFFLTCEFENPIMETWWVEDDPDYDYVAIIKDVPLLVYETIINEKIIYEKITEYINLPPEFIYIDKPLPPEIMLQYINIKNIEFVLFAGDSNKFNGDHGEDGLTDLKQEEKNTNTKIVGAAANMLHEDSNLFVILHGHANPVTGDKSEAGALFEMSLARADSVAEEILKEYNEGDEALKDRMTTKGYGGSNQLSGSSSTYAGLNRRVEVILFTIDTETLPSQKPKGRM